MEDDVLIEAEVEVWDDIGTDMEIASDGSGRQFNSPPQLSRNSF